MFLCCRNRAKKDSLTTVNLVFLLLKTVLDCISRLIIFATFMFVVNDGQFSTMMTVKAYYSTVAVLMTFNMIINSNEKYCSVKTWIGKCVPKISDFHLLNVKFMNTFIV